MRRRIAAAVFLGVAALAVCGLAAARTFPGEQVLVPALGETSFEVVCHPGERVASGLHFNGNVDPQSAIAVVPLEVARPSQRRVSYRVANLGSADGLFSGSTFCDKAPRAREVAAKKMLAPGASGSATASCPVGTRVLNGGFRATGDALGAAHLRFLRMRGNSSWAVGAVNTDDAPQSITALAYCGKDAPTTARSASTQIAAGNATKAVQAQCPRGREAAMGGFNAGLSASPTPQGLLVGSFYQTNRRTWRARAAYLGSGGPRTLTTFVYCR
jgi:hypothetical protein